MKWLKSITDKTWTVAVNGKQNIIPAKEGSWLELDDSEYNELAQRPVIRSLIKAGAIFISETKPEELANTLPELRGDKAKLLNEVEDLKRQLAEKEQALAHAAADKDQALKDLDEKASGIIDAKDAEITELKKQLKDAKKGK